MSRTGAYALLAVSISSLAFAALFVRLSNAPAAVLAFYRLFLAWAGVGAAYGWMRARGRMHASLRLPWKASAWATLAGICLGFHYAVWFTSLEHTSVASSTMLVTLQPIFVVALSYAVWRERPSLAALMGLALALAGSFLIVAGDARISPTSLYGDLLALAAAFLISLYVMIGRHLRRQDTGLAPYLFVVYGSGAAVLAAWSLAAGEPIHPYPATEWIWFIALAAVPTLLGHTLLNGLLRVLPASAVSVSVLGEPVGATALAAAFLEESVSLRQFAAAVCILVGIMAFLRATKE